MSKKILIIITSAVFFFSSFQAYAQRHIAGQNVVTLDTYVLKQHGVGLSWGRCFFSGQSVFGASFLSGKEEPCKVPVGEEEELISYTAKSRDWIASGGYLFRIIGDRSHSLNLMLGGTVDIGARTYEVPSEGILIPEANFIYGVSPIIKGEYFPKGCLSINLQFRPRLQLYGHNMSEKVFYPEFGIGCSYYFL